MDEDDNYFDSPIAVNPNATSIADLLVANATFQVFDVDDVARAEPLAVYEASSGAAIPVLKSSIIGQLPQFRVEGDPIEVVLKSGSYETRVKAARGMKGAPGKSAFEYAQESGFTGDVRQFSEYLSFVGKTIRDASIIEGELVIETADGETLILGRVVGVEGRGISSVSVADGRLIVGYTDGTTADAGSVAGPPGPPVSTAGSEAGQVYTSNGPGEAPSWKPPSGGGAPATHAHDVGDLRSGGSALLAAIVTFLRSGSAADARAAIGAGTGNGTSNLQLGTTSGTAARGDHGHAASAIPVTPSGALTATNVQAALVQLLGLISAGGASAFVGGMQVMVWDDGWPAKLDGALMRWWISTNDAAATLPDMDIGDVWDRHPDALEAL